MEVLHQLIRERRSPRAFSDKPVEQEKQLLLFEAARWAASSMNEQPWRFIYATSDKSADYNLLLDCLMDGNKAWAQKAPLLLLTLAKKTFAYKDKPNKHAWHDLGLAVGNLSLQATAMGLYIHQMGGFYADKARETLKIPDDFDPVSIIAVGYLGDVDELPEKLRERELKERTRKPLEEIVYKAAGQE